MQPRRIHPCWFVMIPYWYHVVECLAEPTIVSHVSNIWLDSAMTPPPAFDRGIYLIKEEIVGRTLGP